MNDRNLLVSSVIALSLLLNFPAASQAQSSSACQNTIDKVKKEMIQKGTKDVQININPGGARNRRNPTNRTDTVAFSLGASDGSGNLESYNARFSEESFRRINNILSSRNLLNSWANVVVKDCKNMAVVEFCLAQSDCIASFAASREGKAIYRKPASNCNNYDKISWYEECYS